MDGIIKNLPSSPIVITGMGAVCSIGNSLNEYKLGLTNGTEGIKSIERFPVTSSVLRNNKGCTIPQELFKKLENIDASILGALTTSVVTNALEDSLLNTEDSKDIGLCLGTSVGSSFSFINYLSDLISSNDIKLSITSLQTTGAIAGNVAKFFAISGPVVTTSTACTASANAIGRAIDLLNNNRCKYVIAGGVDIFTELTFSGFNSLQAISRGKCSPFDSNRDGLILGDGCGILILEKLETALKRNCKIYSQIVGYSIYNDAHHPTAPEPEGKIGFKCMQDALKSESIENLNYINAHGTGTKANDAMEVNAINLLLEKTKKTKKVFISSTKSMIGHTLGAAGAMELIATSLGIYYNFIPPSINIRNPMPEILLNDKLEMVRDKPKYKKIHLALSNSFGFGGNIASIALKRFHKL